MGNLDFNAGRLGLSSEQLMAIGYKKIENSANLYGYTVSKQPTGKVVVSGPDGTVVRTYAPEDILRGYAS